MMNAVPSKSEEQEIDDMIGFIKDHLCIAKLWSVRWKEDETIDCAANINTSKANVHIAFMRINMTRHADMKDVFSTIVHEMLHVVMAKYDQSVDLVIENGTNNNDQNTSSLVNNEREQLVSALEISFFPLLWMAWKNAKKQSRPKKKGKAKR